MKPRSGRSTTVEILTVAGWTLLPAAILISITTGQVLAALLTAAWAANRVRRPWTWPGGTRIPLLAFFGWILAAGLLVRPYPGDFKDIAGKWGLVLLLPLAYSQRLDGKHLRRALLALAVATVALLPVFLKGFHNVEDGRAISLSGGAPNLGTNMMLAALLCASLAGSTAGMERTVLGTGALLFGGIMGMTLNRGALLGAGAGLTLLTARRRPALLAAGLFTGVVAMAIFPHSRTVERLRSVVEWQESFSSQERMHMWYSGLMMVRDRPLLGFTSRRNFIVWYSTRYRDPGALETVPGHVHNSTIQTAILHGVPGLGLLCWWLLALWRRGRATASEDLAALQPLLLAALVNAQVDFVIADGQRAMMLYTLCGFLLGTKKK